MFQALTEQLPDAEWLTLHLQKLNKATGKAAKLYFLLTRIPWDCMHNNLSFSIAVIFFTHWLFCTWITAILTQPTGLPKLLLCHVHSICNWAARAVLNYPKSLQIEIYARNMTLSSCCRMQCIQYRCEVLKMQYLQFVSWNIHTHSKTLEINKINAKRENFTFE